MIFILFSSIVVFKLFCLTILHISFFILLVFVGDYKENKERNMQNS